MQKRARSTALLLSSPIQSSKQEKNKPCITTPRIFKTTIAHKHERNFVSQRPSTDQGSSQVQRQAKLAQGNQNAPTTRDRRSTKITPALFTTQNSATVIDTQTNHLAECKPNCKQNAPQNNSGNIKAQTNRNSRGLLTQNQCHQGDGHCGLIPEPTALPRSQKASPGAKRLALERTVLPLGEANGSRPWQTQGAPECQAGKVRLEWGKSAIP